MIRFLQTDNRVTKALLVVIIGAASVSMCVYLIPGLMAGGSTSADYFRRRVSALVQQVSLHGR